MVTKYEPNRLRCSDANSQLNAYLKHTSRPEMMCVYKHKPMSE